MNGKVGSVEQRNHQMSQSTGLVDLVTLVQTNIGLTLSAEQIQAFDHYQTLLIDWNAHTNLTAISDQVGITIKHFLDSLMLLTAVTLSPAARVIDVGTGAGFPGLPLRIVRPDLYLTLLEATGKKTAFLTQVVQSLKLDRVMVVTARAEDAGKDIEHRETYDLVTARAVAQLAILAEYLLPLCKIGGQCIALKGETAAKEVESAAKAIETLGGQVSQLTRVDLPTVSDPHYLVVIDKIKATPPAYPRRAGLPSKKPLL